MIKLTGNEKAFLGGLLAFLSTSVVQLAQSGGYTWRKFAWSAGSWVVVHLGVWLATNSPTPPQAPIPQS